MARYWNNHPTLTLRLWKGRLCCWPGNVQRWVAEDDSGELSVKKAPGIGYVPCSRQPYGAAERILESLANKNPQAVAFLRDGFPWVIERSELPPFATITF